MYYAINWGHLSVPLFLSFSVFIILLGLCRESTSLTPGGSSRQCEGVSFNQGWASSLHSNLLPLLSNPTIFFFLFFEFFVFFCFVFVFCYLEASRKIFTFITFLSPLFCHLGMRFPYSILISFS